MDWIKLESEEQLEKLKSDSEQYPVLIFKHSTRCSISSMAKNRIESDGSNDSMDVYYLDLIKYRQLSNKIADDFHVHHESPQVIVVEKGEAVFEASHFDIRWKEIIDSIHAS